MKELFKGALEGMSEILKHEVTKNTSNREVVTQANIAANDSTALLIDFLNEMLTSDIIEKGIFYDIAELDLKDTQVMAKVHGVKTSSFDEDIKAATYHGADIRKNEAGTYQVTILFDV